MTRYGLPGRAATGSALLLAAVALLQPQVVRAQGMDAPQQAPTPPRLLDVLFQDHSVLQRDRPIRVWGTTRPGHEVRVRLDAHAASAKADRHGRWEAQLPALPAGGPHVLTATDGTTSQSIGDLLAGDVWLCSGQSNMELPVWRSLDAASELAGARAPGIRLLTVPQTASPVPLRTLPGEARWQAVDDTSLREFSAACFYFARELQTRVDVPMGLIDASWGGSRIEAWTSGAALATDPRFDDALEVLALSSRDPLAAAARWGEVWGAWWARRAGIASGDRPWQHDDASAGWRPAPAALGPWEQWDDPALAAYDGMVWFRSTVQLSAAQARQGAVLHLGAIDETDMTWVNGRAVGGRYDPGTPRDYPLPPGLLVAGPNRVVINVLDTWREGGMRAPASAYRLSFEDGTSVPLSGWDYRVAPAGEPPPGAPWLSAGGVSTLYNGMVAPLGGTGLRGVLWYQGESNTGEAPAYAALLRQLAAGWRTQFGSRLPFLVVQLAGYGMPPTAPVESGWASLREAQRRVVQADRDMALVVAVDIGDRYDIHPPNKQELGRRLAGAARRQVYAHALAAGGPVPVLATRRGDTVAVRFAGTDAALVTYGSDAPVGFELCGEGVGSCRYASARLDGATVTLQARLPGPATRVRYGWADNPLVNLSGTDGLPVGPFEIAVSDHAANDPVNPPEASATPPGDTR